MRPRRLAVAPFDFDLANSITAAVEVATSGQEPLAHYLTEGEAKGYDPHPLFDSTWYREFYADYLLEAELPFRHFGRVPLRDLDREGIQVFRHVPGGADRPRVNAEIGRRLFR